jgi:hypothetical protein
VCKLVIGLVVAVLANAEVCIEDRVSLNSFSRRALEAEFHELVGVKLLASKKCSPPAVSVVISAHPPAGQANVLGLAYKHGDRVFPEVRIFTQPLLRLLGANASAAQLGRALARVAAHELRHYSAQQLHHDENGLMKAAFDGLQLAAEDSSRFRPPHRY